MAHAGYPIGRGRGAAGRARRRRARVRGALRRGRGDLRARAAPTTCAWPRDEAERAAVLEDAQGRVPGDGPHLAQLLRPGRRDPAHASCPRCSSASTSSRAEYGLQRRQRLPRRRRQPAPARLLRRRATRARPSAPRSWPGRSSTPASTPAARSPASTASASTRSSYMPKMFDERRPRRVPAAALRVRPRRARQPRQGDADAAAVRRGARPLPAAPARGGRAWRSGSDGRPTTAEAAELLRDAAATRGPAGAARAAAGRSSAGAAGAERASSVDTGGLDADRRAQRRRLHRGARGRRAARRRAGARSPRRARCSRSTRRDAGGATIGGVVATADSGPLRHRYGGVRDLVVGMTRGAVRRHASRKAGGKVIKNVAGYDLAKLFAGSFGTLGLIVDGVACACTRCRASTATVVGARDDPARLAPRRRALAARPLEADCLDVALGRRRGRRARALRRRAPRAAGGARAERCCAPPGSTAERRSRTTTRSGTRSATRQRGAGCVVQGLRPPDRPRRACCARPTRGGARSSAAPRSGLSWLRCSTTADASRRVRAALRAARRAWCSTRPAELRRRPGRRARRRRAAR